MQTASVPGVDAYVTLPKQVLFAPWETHEVGVAVENHTDRPIIVTTADLRTSAGIPVVSAATVAHQKAVLAGDALTVEGSLFDDDIGAQARMPRPSYWDWKGNVDVDLFRVVPPGESVHFKGSFRARYDVGDTLKASILYVAIPDDFTYYAKKSERVEKIRDLGAGPIGTGQMVETLRHTVVFQKTSGIPKAAGEILQFGAPGLSPGDAASKQPAYAIVKKQLDAMTMREIVATAPLDVARFEFDIQDARTAAGITSEAPYTRALAAGVWVIDVDGWSHMVGKDDVSKVPGPVCSLADALNESGDLRLDLFYGSEAPDPNGTGAYLQGKGFEVYTHQEKGGTFGGAVRLEAKKLVPFLQALAERSLRVDGRKVVPR